MNLPKQKKSLNLSFIMCHSLGISLVFVAPLQAIITPCSFIHLIHTVDFILLIQKILMVLIGVAFVVNMKIIIEVQNIKGSVVAIVRDTIMNIPLKNLLQRYRKYIHEHNAQIFKK